MSNETQEKEKENKGKEDRNEKVYKQDKEK
jgi:hypothetical protein